MGPAGRLFLLSAPRRPTLAPRRRTLLIPFIVVALLLISPAAASADAPPGPYFNGFETNTAGWSGVSGSTITRRPSFYSNDGGYADRINSATDGYHARLGIDPSPATCSSGGGPRLIYFGPITNWGGYSSIFPTGGYTTRVDIYLDVSYATTHLDTRFDWASAVNRPDGQHRRDFVFNVGTDPLGFVITGGNNSTRCDADPYSNDPNHAPKVHIVNSGWYTFQHVFTGVTGGPLAVSMSVIEKSTNLVLGNWVRADATDIIGVTVGGNRYGWFVQNEFDDLAIDNSERTGLVSTPGCEVKISDGGHITALNGDRGSFGGNAKVAMSGDTSGQQEYQDHGPLQPLRFKALTVEAVICDEDEMTAEIYGRGSVDGEGSYEYQIRLKDDGEGPSADDKYGISIPEVTYASGYQSLDGGNVQIRFA